MQVTQYQLQINCCFTSILLVGKLSYKIVQCILINVHVLQFENPALLLEIFIKTTQYIS